MIKVEEKTFHFDRNAYAKSFEENLSYSTYKKRPTDTRAYLRFNSLRKKYIGYQTGILYITNYVKIILEKEKELLPDQHLTIPKIMSAGFKTIIFEDGLDYIDVVITKDVENLVFPDSFTSFQQGQFKVSEDISGLKYIRFPRKIERFPYGMSLDNMPNLKSVWLPFSYGSLRCSSLISSKEKRLDSYKKDGLLIIQDCLYRIDVKTNVFYVPENVKEVFCDSLNDSIKTIICSPNTRAVKLSGVCFRDPKISLYCPQSIEKVCFDDSIIFFDGPLRAFSPRAGGFTLRPKKIVSTDFIYTQDSVEEITKNQQKQLEELRKLFIDKYKYTPVKPAAKSLHLTCINRENKHLLNDVEELYIDADKDGNECVISLYENVYATNSENGIDNLKKVYIDKNIKKIKYDVTFNYPNLIQGVDIYYDSTAEHLKSILDERCRGACPIPVHCTDLTFIFGEEKRLALLQELRESRPPTRNGIPQMKNSVIDFEFNKNVVLCSGDYPDVNWIERDGFDNAYEQIQFLDNNMPLYTHYYDPNDNIEDNVEHDFISGYYFYHYDKIKDFDVPSYEKPDLLKGETTRKILEVYKSLIIHNPQFKKFGDLDIINMLAKVKCQILKPAVMNTDTYYPSVLYFLTVRNITSIPLLLLVAIYKVIFKYISVSTAYKIMNLRAIVYKKTKEQTNVTFYMYGGAKQASKFSGFSVNDFDYDHIGLKDEANPDLDE